MADRSMSGRKYWSTAELARDAAYWRKGEAFADDMIRKTWDRSGYQSPRWSLAKNKAHMNAAASEAEIAKRKVPA
ncbi:hypothetical protein NKJ23_15840 [Mesorhizobium sp. M0184]|uniref:hypothetical protein n=1 Tax=Mesorhizobium sp. M0184 TaxID=2956906 RepID=UPI00333BFC96